MWHTHAEWVNYNVWFIKIYICVASEHKYICKMYLIWNGPNVANWLFRPDFYLSQFWPFDIVANQCLFVCACVSVCVSTLS